jgi:hypothetical protein
VSPNLTIARLGPTGGISFFAQQGAINLAVDLVGYTLPLSAVGTGGGVPLLTGEGPPAAGLGNNGDVYLDTTSGLFFGPKVGGTWPPPIPTPPPAAVAEGADDVGLFLNTDVGPAFGPPETVWTVTGLPVAGDYLLDAAITVAPGAGTSIPISVRCWWSTRPDRIFSAALTPLGLDDVSLHAVTLAVPGSIAGGTTAELVCQGVRSGLISSPSRPSRSTPTRSPWWRTPDIADGARPPRGRRRPAGGGRRSGRPRSEEYGHADRQERGL